MTQRRAARTFFKGGLLGFKIQGKLNMTKIFGELKDYFLRDILDNRQLPRLNSSLSSQQRLDYLSQPKGSVSYVTKALLYRTALEYEKYIDEFTNEIWPLTLAKLGSSKLLANTIIYNDKSYYHICLDLLPIIDNKNNWITIVNQQQKCIAKILIEENQINLFTSESVLINGSVAIDSLKILSNQSVLIPGKLTIKQNLQIYAEEVLLKWNQYDILKFDHLQILCGQYCEINGNLEINNLDIKAGEFQDNSISQIYDKSQIISPWVYYNGKCRIKNQATFISLGWGEAADAFMLCPGKINLTVINFQLQGTWAANYFNLFAQSPRIEGTLYCDKYALMRVEEKLIEQSAGRLIIRSGDINCEESAILKGGLYDLNGLKISWDEIIDPTREEPLIMDLGLHAFCFNVYRPAKDKRLIDELLEKSSKLVPDVVEPATLLLRANYYLKLAGKAKLTYATLNAISHQTIQFTGNIWQESFAGEYALYFRSQKLELAGDIHTNQKIALQIQDDIVQTGSTDGTVVNAQVGNYVFKPGSSLKLNQLNLHAKKAVTLEPGSCLEADKSVIHAESFSNKGKLAGLETYIEADQSIFSTGQLHVYNQTLVAPAVFLWTGWDKFSAKRLNVNSIAAFVGGFNCPYSNINSILSFSPLLTLQSFFLPTDPLIWLRTVLNIGLTVVDLFVPGAQFVTLPVRIGLTSLSTLISSYAMGSSILRNTRQAYAFPTSINLLKAVTAVNQLATMSLYTGLAGVTMYNNFSHAGINSFQIPDTWTAMERIFPNVAGLFSAKNNFSLVNFSLEGFGGIESNFNAVAFHAGSRVGSYTDYSFVNFNTDTDVSAFASSTNAMYLWHTGNSFAPLGQDSFVADSASFNAWTGALHYHANVQTRELAVTNNVIFDHSSVITETFYQKDDATFNNSVLKVTDKHTVQGHLTLNNSVEHNQHMQVSGEITGTESAVNTDQEQVIDAAAHLQMDNVQMHAHTIQYAGTTDAEHYFGLHADDEMNLAKESIINNATGVVALESERGDHGAHVNADQIFDNNAQMKDAADLLAGTGQYTNFHATSLLSVETKQVININQSIHTTASIAAKGSSVTITNSELKAKNISLTATDKDITQTNSTITAEEQYSENAAGSIINSNSHLAGQQGILNTEHGNIVNQNSSSITASQYLQVTALEGQVINQCEHHTEGNRQVYTPSTIQGGTGEGHDGIGLNLQADKIINYGLVQSDGSNYIDGKHGVENLAQWNQEIVRQYEDDGWFSSESYTETDTHVNSALIQSVHGTNYIHSEVGAIRMVASSAISATGNEFSAPIGGVETREVLRVHETFETDSYLWGLFEDDTHTRTEMSAPTYIVDTNQLANSAIISEHGTVSLHGTTIITPGDMKIEGKNLDISREIHDQLVEHHSFMPTMSLPFLDTPPIVGNLINDVSTITQNIAGSINMAIDAINASSVVSSAIRNQNLGMAALQQTSLGDARGFNPSFGIGVTETNSVTRTQTAGAGEITVGGSLTIKATEELKLDKGIPIDVKKDLHITAPHFIQRGMNTQYSSEENATTLMVNVTPLDGVTGGSVAYSEAETHGNQWLNQEITVGGTATVIADVWDKQAGSLVATALDEQVGTINEIPALDYSSSSSLSVSLDTGGGFSFATQDHSTIAIGDKIIHSESHNFGISGDILDLINHTPAETIPTVSLEVGNASIKIPTVAPSEIKSVVNNTLENIHQIIKPPTDSLPNYLTEQFREAMQPVVEEQTQALQTDQLPIYLTDQFREEKSVSTVQEDQPVAEEQTLVTDPLPTYLTEQSNTDLPLENYFLYTQNQPALEDYSFAILRGVWDGAKNTAYAFTHAYDNIIYPMYSFLHDGDEIGHDIYGNYTPEFYASLGRMWERAVAVENVGLAFYNGTGPERAEMAASTITSFLLPGGIVKGISGITNLARFGTIFRPVAETLYRGDFQTPEISWQKGFVARGQNLDLYTHAMAYPSADSAYVSTSILKEIALRFPGRESFPSPAPVNMRSYIYEIQSFAPTIDVGKELSSNIPLKVDPEDFAIYKQEQERAFLHKINVEDIKGAWPVDIKKVLADPEYFSFMNGLDDAGYEFTRELHENYIPNPHFQEPGLLRTLQSLQMSTELPLVLLSNLHNYNTAALPSQTFAAQIMDTVRNDWNHKDEDHINEYLLTPTEETSKKIGEFAAAELKNVSVRNNGSFLFFTGAKYLKEVGRGLFIYEGYDAAKKVHQAPIDKKTEVLVEAGGGLGAEALCAKIAGAASAPAGKIVQILVSSGSGLFCGALVKNGGAIVDEIARHNTEVRKMCAGNTACVKTLSIFPGP